MCWSYRPDSPWVSQHQMSLNGKRDNFELKDLLAVAKLITNLDGRKVVKEVVEAVRRWREFADVAGMTDDNLIEQIESTHRLYLGDGL